jgi:uncharacterized SAM-binding protein YcdF (DUF218 family)
MLAVLSIAILFAAIGVLLPVWKDDVSSLKLAAYKWAVSDLLTPADAAVVLGGGAARPYAAAELYRKGLVTRILVDEERNRRLILDLNVPAEAVDVFGTGLKNTHHEACALTDWAMKTGIHRFIVPTEVFSSRRVRWVFSRSLATVGAEAEIDLLQVPGYSVDDWWLHSAGRKQFVTEITKYFYYRLRYISAQC